MSADTPALRVIKNDSGQEAPNAWYEGDTWNLEQLGVIGSPTERQLSINFKNISQNWLKELIKKYLKVCAINGSAAKIVQSISALKLFSKFLAEESLGIQPYGINRGVIEDYFSYLKKKNIKIATRQNRIINLSGFLKACHTRKWIKDIDACLIYPEDCPKIPKNVPRCIPETVMQQLKENICFLDNHLRRLMLVFQECGMRISEVCSLKYDCLLKDSDGDSFIKIFQSKLNKEYTVPISKEAASVVLEQQKIIKEEFGHHELIFPVPIKLTLVAGRLHSSKSAGKQWRRKTIVRHLNDLAKQKNIVGPTGEIWHFDTHSFRHTTATRMINSGTPQHIVQRFLGHESPTMTSRYAHIYDETLKQEFSKFKGKMVNIAGETLNPEQLITDIAQGTNINDIDSKWLKKNILMQALPNGTCALPAISNACPHANACLSCTNFRTDKRYVDLHKNQLEQTIKIVDIARSNGWKRQEEMNTCVANNLQKIISTLDG